MFRTFTWSTGVTVSMFFISTLRADVTGNVTPFTKTSEADPLLSVQELEFSASQEVITATPDGETPSAREAFRLVLERIGPETHDAGERRIVNGIRERTGHVDRRNEKVDIQDRLQTKFPRSQLDTLAKSFPGRLGFYAKDVHGGAEYAWNGDQRFPPASVIKLPVMIQLYREAAAGDLQLDEKRRLPNDISTHGTGVLKDREAPVELSLREYCRLMMIQSDNMATDLVIRTVGTKATNQFLDDQGCRNTRVSLELNGVARLWMEREH